MKQSPFSTIATLCQQLEKTTKKLEKSALISSFMKNLQPKKIAPAVLLLLGKIFSATDCRTLNVNWRTLQKIVAQVAKSKKAPLTILAVL